MDLEAKSGFEARLDWQAEHASEFCLVFQPLKVMIPNPAFFPTLKGDNTFFSIFQSSSCYIIPVFNFFYTYLFFCLVLVHVSFFTYVLLVCRLYRCMGSLVERTLTGMVGARCAVNRVSVFLQSVCLCI